ncbi:hypothetical protein F4805DRAFT_439097 [Annulohypoxylon moriforme]|nr:hypothetical protein F4805DRAFT_439097 [Annulohypoxylon moriforme]
MTSKSDDRKTITDLSAVFVKSTEDILSENISRSVVAGTKRSALNNTVDWAYPGTKRAKCVKQFGFKEAFQPIVDSVPSEDAPIPEVRQWFFQVSAIHGLSRQKLPEIRQMCLLGHSLRQASYADLKDYLVSLAKGDKGDGGGGCLCSTWHGKAGFLSFFLFFSFLSVLDESLSSCFRNILKIQSSLLK